MTGRCQSVLIILLLASLQLAAQVAVVNDRDPSLFFIPETTAIFGQPTMSQQAANTAQLGWGTGINYDSNALNSQPRTAEVQYTFYPLIGLNLARPHWGAVLNFAPGFAYSTANLPQYQAFSLTSTVAFKYQPSERLSFGLSNSFVSSSNPFNSLSASQGITNAATIAANYLPRINESALVEAAYGTTARASLLGAMSYNYISYQHNDDIPDAAQPFRTSTSTQVSMGLSYSLTPKYSESILYVTQFLSAGQGIIKTVGQSIEYRFAYAPKPGLRVSGMIGPQFVESTYGGTMGNGNIANTVGENTSEWTWTGSLAVSQTLGKNQLSANVSKQLNIGTQYQGSVQGTTFGANFSRPLARKTDLAVFGSYNINQPVFLVQLASRLSNNYASTGATLSKTITEHWVVNGAYWYLFQNTPQNGQQLYAGDHNRVAISLTYSLTRALPR